jgi:tyrosinase
MSGTADAAVRTRKNVATLGKPGDELDWYAKAVAELRRRPVTDPTSWRYLAAVHGYPGPAKDPFASAGEALPSAAEQRQFWNQCQHQTWFFLPWHRGYLTCFEEIVADAVVKLGGPPGWALPYWNYSDAANPEARALPAAFLSRSDAQGGTNPLWSPGRNLKASAELLPAGDVDLDALLHVRFGGSARGGDPGFGGPATEFSHFGGVNGRLENLPHNVIHDDVGGLMSDPDTAALDPIFWLHHSNIDRLWQVWALRGSDSDPISAGWLTGITFLLHDATGAVVKFDASQMRDPTTVRHGYRYDDVSDPIARVPTAAASAAALARLRTAPQSPVLVGASPTAIALSGPSTSVRVAFDRPSRLAAIARLAGARPVRAFLNLENITGTGLHGSYEVYIDAPSTDPTAAGRPPLLAGHLSTFGVHKASLPSGPHAGSGITSVLEISPLIEQLDRERGWDGAHLDLTFVRKGSARAAGPGGPQIGRVSVYYA